MINYYNYDFFYYIYQYIHTIAHILYVITYFGNIIFFNIRATSLLSLLNKFIYCLIHNKMLSLRIIVFFFIFLPYLGYNLKIVFKTEHP